MSERVQQGSFEKLKGVCIGLAAPFVMLFAAFMAVPDIFRVRRMRRM